MSISISVVATLALAIQAGQQPTQTPQPTKTPQTPHPPIPPELLRTAYLDDQSRHSSRELGTGGSPRIRR
jgi:hypothetical protein